MRRPLLIIDGDSFAHRAYHALPKTIRRRGNKGAGAILGRFSAQADKLRLYKKIATMDKSAPLPALRNQKPTWERAAKLAHDWRLNKLAERLEGLAEDAP